MDNIEKFFIDGVDFTHYRLVDLLKLANQAKPFYLWIEKQFQLEAHCNESFEKLIKTLPYPKIVDAIKRCFNAQEKEKIPKLYDGGGIPYAHEKACYFMFAWIARDAATQRLRPLISKVKSKSKCSTRDIEIEALSLLIFTYREQLCFFDWPVIREVTLQRLEGSRRAKKGTFFENYLRSSLAQAFSYYFQTHGNYGKYKDFTIIPTPLKINSRTYDAVVELTREDGSIQKIIIPSKTRETEGGGHAHLFTRDIEQANLDILEIYPDAIIAFMIVAQNWSQDEINDLKKRYSQVFYFDCNPNEFAGFGDRQVDMNKFLESILD